jgi:hypothetical protein
MYQELVRGRITSTDLQSVLVQVLTYGSAVRTCRIITIIIRARVKYCKGAKIAHIVKNGHLRVFVNQNKKTGINAKIAKIGNR